MLFKLVNGGAIKKYVIMNFSPGGVAAVRGLVASSGSLPRTGPGSRGGRARSQRVHEKLSREGAEIFSLLKIDVLATYPYNVPHSLLPHIIMKIVMTIRCRKT